MTGAAKMLADILKFTIGTLKAFLPKCSGKLKSGITAVIRFFTYR